MQRRNAGYVPRGHRAAGANRGIHARANEALLHAGAVDRLGQIRPRMQLEMNCAYCQEIILPGERADSMGATMHRECAFRMVAGSVAHLMRECGCFVKGSTQHEPIGLTVREGARLAWDYAHQKILPIYGVFEHPLDAPEKYVVRTTFVWGGRVVVGQARYADTLAEARNLIPQGLVPFEVAPGDPPSLVESWL